MVCVTLLQQLARARTFCLSRPGPLIFSRFTGTTHHSHSPLRFITMSAGEASGSTVPRKRPLDDEESASFAPSTNKAPRLDNDGDSGFDAPLNASAKGGPSADSTKGATRGKGKNSKVPIPRRQAREARRGTTTRRGTRPEGEPRPDDDGESSRGPRLPKRQCALLLGFCGSGYSGMQ